VQPSDFDSENMYQSTPQINEACGISLVKGRVSAYVNQKDEIARFDGMHRFRLVLILLVVVLI